MTLFGWMDGKEYIVKKVKIYEPENPFGVVTVVRVYLKFIREDKDNGRG